MRTLLLTTIFTAIFGLYSDITAQTLTVFGGNTDLFPRVQASFYARDAQNKPIQGLTPINVTITEDGISRRVISVTCPPESAPAKISSVLVMDVSGSMARGMPSNMEIAKVAARWWIQALPADGSECAVTSFESDSYVNQDFTVDKNLLRSAIDALAPGGGTNYDAGLITPPGGACEVVKRAKNKRIVVFLTDGEGTGDEQQILQQAAATGVQVYCVGVNLVLPKLLKNVAEQTGGAWYEGISSPESITDVYGLILQRATSLAPCEIVWETDVSCKQNRSTTLSVPSAGLQAKLNYTVPGINLPRVELSTLSLRFKGVAPGASDTALVTVTGASDSVIITGITSSNPAFTILDAPPPVWILNRGQSRTFRVRFAPGDSALTFAQIHLDGNVCIGSTLYGMGGFPGKRKAEAMLRVVRPNGGERLVTGDTATLEWSGILPVDTVRLDYSTDASATWLPVAEKAAGLSYIWRVPPTPSNRCLLRARQISLPKGADTVIFFGTGRVHDVCFSPDGTRIVSGGSLGVWDASTGLQTLSPSYTGTATCVSWSPDGKYIGVSGSSTNTILYEADNPTVSIPLSGVSANAASCDFSKDGLYFLRSGSTSDIDIWDVQSGAHGLIATGHTAAINSVRTDRWFVDKNNPNAVSLITAGADRSGKIIHTDIQRQGNTLTTQSTVISTILGGDVARGACSHPDGFTDAVVGFNNGTLIFRSGKTVTPLPGDFIGAIDWSPNGEMLAIAFNSGKLAVYNIALDRIVRVLDTMHISGIAIRWDPFDSRIVAGFANKGALIWTIDDVVEQEDVSDNLWEIVSPQIIAQKNVDLGLVRVGFSHDSTVESIICITANAPSSARLDSAVIINDADGAFGIVSGVPAKFPTFLPACLPVELQFSPKRVGLATATLRLFSGGTAFDVTLNGTGFELEVAYPSRIIDFGKIPVGLSRDTLVDPSTVNLSNIVPLQITHTAIAGPDIQQFTITGGDTVISLSPQDSAKLYLQFAPKTIGRSSSRVRIDFTREGIVPTPGAPIFIQLFGEGICSVDSSKAIASDFGAKAIDAVTGKILQLPLVVHLAAGQDINALPPGFGCTLVFNGTMLYPLDPLPFGTIDLKGIRTLTVTGKRMPASDTLTLLPMLTMLGNDTAVTVRIDSLWFEGGCPIPVSADSLTIIYTDICAVNGAKRLLETSGITAVAMLPDPAGETADAVITLTEDTPIALEIHDALGRTLQTERQTLPAGNHRMHLDFAALPVGVYTAVLTTRSEVVFTRFIKQ